MPRRKTPKQPKTTPTPPERGIVLVNPPPSKGAGRSEFWITPERIKAVELLLEGGGTDRDACERLGLSQASFYLYLQTGRAMKGLEAMPKLAPQPPASRALCSEFLEAVTRARATARLKAVNAVMSAIEGATAGERTTVTYSETMLDRAGNVIRDKDGNPELYIKQTITEKVIHHAPDWRAGIEYVARRDKADWNNGNTQAAAVPFEEKVVGMIKAGSVDYPTLLSQFNDKELVIGWFELAGVTPVYESEDATNG